MNAKIPAERLILVGLLTVLSAVLALGAIYSLELRVGFDTAIGLYYARLIDQHGVVPYRDTFEFNFPGALYLYVPIGRIIGYTNERALRWVDLGYLAAISAATWAWLKPLGWRAAWGAMALFGLAYVGADTTVVGQRDYFVILPIVIAATVAARGETWGAPIKAGIAGLMCGLAATVKPHALIGLPALLGMIIADEWQAHPRAYRRIAIRALLPAFIGTAIPVAAAVGFLVANNTLEEFLTASLEYTPLYGRVAKDLTVIEGPERLAYIVTSLLGLNGMLAWLIPAGLGVASFLVKAPSPAGEGDRGQGSERRLRWQVYQMVGLAISYWIYPAISGQFFDYHWIIFVYFLMALSALAFNGLPRSWPGWARALPALAILAALIAPPSWTPNLVGRMSDHWIAGKPIPPVDGGVADEIAAYLSPRLRPDDKVQVLGSGGAPLHGLLLADALPATRWLQDLSLHHDISTPVIARYRRDFARALDESRARYVIDMAQRSFIRGPDSSPLLPEVSAILDEHYQIAYVGRAFSIYERELALSRGIVVYPMKPADIPTLFHPSAASDVFAVTPARADGIGDDSALADFVSGHDLIQVEFLGGGVDPGQAIESALARQAFRVGEAYIATTRTVEYVTPTDTCLETQPAGVLFGASIRLERAGVALIERGGSRWACVRLEWSAQTAIAESYKISLRLIAPDGTLVAQADSQPAGYTAPTTSWQIGETVIDQSALALTVGAPAGTYRVEVVVYNEATMTNLPASGPGAQDEIVVVGTLSAK